MINKILIIIIIFFCFNCTGTKSLNNPVKITHSSLNMSVEIELESIKRIKRSNKENDWSYFYYGTFEAQIAEGKKPKEIRLKYKEKESQIYFDSIGDFNFWHGNWWNSDGFRKDKIYVSFDEPNIEWNLLEIIEVEIPKPMTKKEVCDMLKRNSSSSYSQECKDIPNTNKMSIKTACSLVSEESEAAKTCKELKKNEEN